MIQVFLEHDQIGQISVSRKFRLAEDYTVSKNNVVRNSTIRNFLIVAADLTDTKCIEQNSVIKNFLITARKEHHYDF